MFGRDDNDNRMKDPVSWDNATFDPTHQANFDPFDLKNFTGTRPFSPFNPFNPSVQEANRQLWTKVEPVKLKEEKKPSTEEDCRKIRDHVFSSVFFNKSGRANYAFEQCKRSLPSTRSITTTTTTTTTGPLTTTTTTIISRK